MIKLILHAGVAGQNQSVNQKKISIEIAKNYYDALIENDIKTVDNVSRDVNKVKLLLRSYARNISTECSIETIISDIKGNDNKSIRMKLSNTT